MQPEAMQISQSGVGSGAVGEAWSGGDSADAGGGLAAIVTVENTSPQTADSQVALLWVPHDATGTKLDVAGEANLAQDGGDPHLWTFRPTAGVRGTWRIRLREIVAGAPVDEIRTFSILHDNGLAEPALNERADPDASLVFNLAQAIANSENNEGQTWAGWQRWMRAVTELLGGGGSATTAPLDIYVDGDAGDDANPGTIASPVQTRNGARALVPLVVRHVVKVHYKTAATQYLPGEAWVRVLEEGGYIEEFADDAWDPAVYSNVRSGTTAAGTTAEVIVDSVGGLVVNADQEFFVEVTSGAAIGQRRLVRNNSATDVVPSYPLSPAPGVGDTYRIFRPAIEWDFEALPAGGNTSYLAANLAPYPPVGNALAGDVRPAHVFAGFDFVHASARRVTTAGNVVFYGCRASGASNHTQLHGGVVQAGLDSMQTVARTARIPALHLGAVSNSAWLGWGLVSKGNLTINGPFWLGFVNAVSATSSPLIWAQGKIEWFGGFTRGFYTISAQVRAFGPTPTLQVLIDNLETAFSQAVVDIGSDSQPCSFTGLNTRLNASGSNKGLRVRGAAATAQLMPTTFTGESETGISLHAVEGGRVVYSQGFNPTGFGRAVGDDHVVGHVSPAAVDGTAIAFNKTLLGATLKSVLAADGSFIGTGQNVAFALSADRKFAVTPPEITSDENDYTPTNVQIAGALRLSSDAAWAITGLAAPSSGVQEHAVHNVGSFAITLKNQDVLSVAENRFLFGIDLPLLPNDSVTLWYDPVSDRWRAT